MNTNDLLKKKFDELRAERDALLAQTKEKRRKREDLVNKMEAMRPEIDALTAEINSVTHPRLGVISAEMTKIGKVLGFKALSDN